jgi:nicotinamide mononucleotide adenylyltransferase
MKKSKPLIIRPTPDYQTTKKWEKYIEDIKHSNPETIHWDMSIAKIKKRFI